MVQMGINLNSIMLKVLLKEMLSIMQLVVHLKKEHIGNENKKQGFFGVMLKVAKYLKT